jgi:CelD/BcsL family acetyltransferase involved in cellulose biosynthesis
MTNTWYIHVALLLPGPVGGCASENANDLENHVTLEPAPRPSQLAATPRGAPKLAPSAATALQQASWKRKIRKKRKKERKKEREKERKEKE